MNALQIAALALYVIGVFVVGIGSWKIEFHDHGGDPFLAAMGLFIAIMFGLSWPMWLAVAPFAAGLYLIGKAIVRNTKG